MNNKLINIFSLNFKHEILLVYRQYAEVTNILLFFIIVVSLFPLAVGSDAITLQNIAPGIIWVVALLAVILMLGFFGVGTSWVYISIHQFGNTSAVVASILTGLMILYLALFPAVQGYFLTRVFPENTWNKLCLAFPTTWILLEWARGWLLSGFPWLFIGASQTDSPLRGLLPIIGEYGVTFVVVFTSSVIIAVIRNLFFLQPNRRLASFFEKNIISILAVILLWLCGFIFSDKLWVTAEKPAVKVTLVQGNIPQQLKWDPAFMQSTIYRYYDLTQAHWDSQIIVWPEAAIPYLMNQSKDLLNGLAQQASQHNTALVTGIPVQDKSEYYNALIVLGNGKGVYYKRHLVPFGEYLPLDFLLRGLINFFNLPMSDFSSGPKHHATLIANGVRIAPFICYEIAFPSLVLSELPQSEALITVSDDAWFGDSLALGQHLQIARLRAIETGRYLLFCSNTGLTAIVNPQGKIQLMATPFKATTITGMIERMTGATPYVEMGDDVIIVLFVVLFILTAYLESRRLRNSNTA